MDQVEHAADFGLQPEIGFSNSEPVKEAPQDVIPDAEPPQAPEPGFTNAKSVGSSEAKVVSEAQVEDKSVKPAKKTAAKK